MKLTKKLTTFLTLAGMLSLAGTLPGQESDLIAYEGFGYEPGFSIEGRNGGYGWQFPWAWRTSLDGKGLQVANSAIIERGSLRYGDLETTGHHVHLTGANGQLELGRRFGKALTGEAGTSTYVSFLAQRVGPLADTAKAGYKWGDNAYPRGASIRFWNGSGGEQLSLGNYSNQALDQWAVYGQDMLLHSGISFSESMVFVVARAIHNEGADDLYLWINPDPHQPEAGNNPVLVLMGDQQETPLDFSNLIGISPFVGQGDAERPHAELIFDEFRVGRSWDAVTPTSPQWAGYPESGQSDVDTGEFLGRFHAGKAPWLWHHSLSGWLYCPEESVSPWGAWIHFPDRNANPPAGSGEGTWFGYPVDASGFVTTGDFIGTAHVTHHPWIWSRSMQLWLHVAGDPLQPSGELWAYAIDHNDLTLPLGGAVNPQPADGDFHVDDADDKVTLAWDSGTGVISHDVYFGTDPEAVAGAWIMDDEYMGNQLGNQFTVEGLSSLETYYWRIDERGGSGAFIKGDVWSFRPRQLAFAGAEGHGRFAIGGRGGKVFVVTNLDDSGPGSLREAIEAEGPRTVVFNVGGLITLDSPLLINDERITLAGQTAPGKGITIRKYKLGLSGAEDVVIRFLRVRPGNIAGITTDGMGMQGSDHCIFDHCSISWTIDESFSSRSARNITLQKTLIAEALNIAGHKNYPAGTQHGFAASISGKVGSFHHNLLAHCAGRNWSLAGGLDASGVHTGSLDIRNNVVYNWGHRTTDGGAQYVNFVGNYYKEGPASTKDYFLDLRERNPFGPQVYFVEGNIFEERGGNIAVDQGNQLEGVQEPGEPRENYLRDAPFFPSHITEHSASGAYKAVLSDVGVNIPQQDDQDTRIIRETLTGTTTYTGSVSGKAGLPDSQEDVGGWEDYPEVHRAPDYDSDLDGLPDWWEELHGLNPASAAGDFSDANADPDGDELTNLDDFLDWMAVPRFACPAGGSVQVDLEPYFRGYTDNPVLEVVEILNGSFNWVDATTMEFSSTLAGEGLASVTVKVTDGEGATLSRTFGIRVLAD